MERIKALGIEGAVHVTAVEASRDDIARHCDLVLSRGIENLVTIRGDVPKDPSFSPPRRRLPVRRRPDPLHPRARAIRSA